MHIRILAATLALTCAVGCGGAEKKEETILPPPGGAEAMPTPKPLFERLGGMPGIEGVVDELLKNVMADARINARFKNADQAGLRQKLIDQVCQVTGGPCTYTGKDMASAHQGMNIRGEEWDALVEDLVKALDSKGVPQKEKDDLLGLLGPLKKEIVGK